MAMAPSSEVTMFTSSHGRSAGAGRASAATRAATSSTSPGSGHNRRMRANATGGRLGAMACADPAARRRPARRPPPPRRVAPVPPAGWLRAAVLGANDGVVSTAALIVGVASSGSSLAAVRTAGIAGLVAGAMSMAAGEYVSVASQRDTEEADLRMEAQALRDHPRAELAELAEIWRVARPRAGPGPGGGPAAHRGRRPRRPRPRRARAHRGLHGPARAGGGHLGAGLLARCRCCRCSPTSPPRRRRARRSRSWWRSSRWRCLGALGAALGGARRLRATLRVAIGGAAAMARHDAHRRAHRRRPRLSPGRMGDRRTDGEHPGGPP